MQANNSEQPEEQLVIIRGHEENIYDQPPVEFSPFGTKITSGDPRIKSPNDLLKEKAPNRTEFLAEELKALKARHDKEIESWQAYDTRIHAWKKEVTTIVENLKRELTLKNKLVEDLKQENQKLKNR